MTAAEFKALVEKMGGFDKIVCIHFNNNIKMTVMGELKESDIIEDSTTGDYIIRRYKYRSNEHGLKTIPVTTTHYLVLVEGIVFIDNVNDMQKLDVGEINQM